MRFRVKHVTRYDYTRPVFLEPHLIRLHPRCDPNMSLISYHLKVIPEPAGLSVSLDAENNPFHLAWFDGYTEKLEVTAQFCVETHKTNPFSSFLTSGEQFPLHLTPLERAALEPSLAPVSNMDSHDCMVITELAETIGHEARNSILPFLSGLNQHLNQHITRVERKEEGIQSIGETLTTGTGACRDVTVVFLAIARQMGIPARFVSGCQEGDPKRPDGELHAWAEIYLPGFGWLGFDPTHGLAVADRHIPYSASALPENSAPIQGSFRASTGVSSIHHHIEIEPG